MGSRRALSSPPRAEILIIAAIVAATPQLAAQETPRETPDTIRARVTATPLETELTVTVASGETFEGPLAEVRDEEFGIWVDDEATRERVGMSGAKLKKWIRFDDVRVLGGATRVALDAEALAFRMRIGDDIRLRTEEGEIYKGELEDFDGGNLQLDGRRFSLSEGNVQKIELREDDSLRNGVLVGAASGLGLVGLACLAGCEAEIAVVGGLFYAGVGAGLGALFDALRRETHVVYVGPRSRTTWSLQPMVTGDAKGVAFSISF